MLVRVIVSWLSNRPQNKNFSQGYDIVAFPEAAKNNYQSGLWCRCFPRSLDRKMSVRVMVSFLSQYLRQRNVSQGYCVLAFIKAAEEKYQLGLWCLEIPRSRERKMLVRVMVMLLSQMPRQRNVSQGYGILAFMEAAEETCQLELWCFGFFRSREKVLVTIRVS